jgi:hypothetical protein
MEFKPGKMIPKKMKNKKDEVYKKRRVFVEKVPEEIKYF